MNADPVWPDERAVRSVFRSRPGMVKLPAVNHEIAEP